MPRPAAAALIDAIGSSDFAAGFFSFWHGILPIQQCTAWHVAAGVAPLTLVAERPGEKGMVEGLCRLWALGDYRDDPVIAGAAPGLSVTAVDLAALDNQAYRSRFFEGAGLGGKLAICKREAGGAFYVNLYRQIGQPVFSEAEKKLVIAAAPLALACLAKHAEIWGRSSAPESAEALFSDLVAFFNNHGARLSGREADVCAYAVMGYSTEATALNLGVSKSSALTYRERAYTKLAATGIADLFAIYLTGRK